MGRVRTSTHSLTHSFIHFIHIFIYFSQAIGQGLDSVRRIVNEKHLTGVYGPLIDNFTCDRKIFTAVEVTAGNR